MRCFLVPILDLCASVLHEYELDTLYGHKLIGLLGVVDKHSKDAVSTGGEGGGRKGDFSVATVYLLRLLGYCREFVYAFREEV